MRHLLFIIVFLSSILTAGAQELRVKSFTPLPMDLTARKQQRLDLNGKPCAMLKIMVMDDITDCNKSNIGDIATSGVMKLVYLPSVVRSVTLNFKYHYPLTITFADYGVTKLEGSATYELRLVDALQMMMENGNAAQQTASVTTTTIPNVGNSQNANTAQQTSTATTTQNVDSGNGRSLRRDATGTNWSDYENNKLSLFKYGGYKDGKELNTFFGSGEYMLLHNGVLEWNDRQDGDTKYNARVSGNVIYITPKGKAPSYVKWIRIERRDDNAIFTYDNLGTYRYLRF